LPLAQELPIRYVFVMGPKLRELTPRPCVWMTDAPATACSPDDGDSMSGQDDAALAAMLGRVPVPAAAKADLVRRMSGPDRHYHGIGHLATLWTRHRSLCPGTGMDDPNVEMRIAATILWHDAVYVPGRHDNEQESAALWRGVCHGGDLSASDVDWIAAAITATSDHIAARPTTTQTLDQRSLQWLLDLDLSPLGEPPEAFVQNTNLLALEYANSQVDWRRQRVAFLRRIAGCTRIYCCAPIAAAFEAQARTNIARELASSA
jgi:predicted metal-dependent HD superfamily phosphohydrolase